MDVFRKYRKAQNEKIVPQVSAVKEEDEEPVDEEPKGRKKMAVDDDGECTKL